MLGPKYSITVSVVKTPITLSGSFSVETLTGLTPSWKMELQHHHETCCEKGGRHGRQACMVRKWFHRGDVVSRQVDLYMTITRNIEHYPC